MIRDDPATREAIELYLLVNENRPIMHTIEHMAERLRSFAPSLRSPLPVDGFGASKPLREGNLELIAENA